MMTGAGKFFINLSFALCGTFRGGAAKVCIFASGDARHDVGLDRLQRADRRHDDHPGDEAHRLPRVLRGRDRGLRIDRRGAGAAGDGCDRVRDRAVPERQLRRGGAGRGHSRRCSTTPACSCRSTPTRRATASQGLPREELPRIGQTLREGWYYLFVIALLVFMLLVMKRESHAPFWATLLLLVLNQLFNRDRWGWRDVQRLPRGQRPHLRRTGRHPRRLRPADRRVLDDRRDLEPGQRPAAHRRRQRAAAAGDDRGHQPGAGPGSDHHGLLHLPGDPGRPGAGEGRPEQDGRAHVRLLLGHAVGDHAAGGDRLVRGRRDCRRAGDEDRVGIDAGRGRSSTSCRSSSC